MAKMIEPKVDINDLRDVFEGFLNEYDYWVRFQEHIESQGYTMTELGFPEE